MVSSDRFLLRSFFLTSSFFCLVFYIAVSPIAQTGITVFALTNHYVGSVEIYATSAQVTGKVYSPDTGSAAAGAIADMEAAYTAGSAQGPNNGPNTSEFQKGQLNQGTIIHPGLYTWSTTG